MENQRKEYRDGGEITIPDPSQPLEVLSEWLEEAKSSGVTEPNAMSLATVDSEGRPHNRMVLLKHLQEETIGFFTNLESDKSVQIDSCDSVAVVIWWPEMERQVRIEGKASQMPRETVELYHSKRPRKSRIAARASDQSRPLGSREELIARFEGEESKFDGADVPLPDYWGGFFIDDERVEYWSGRPSRLHERVVLNNEGGTWSQQRLYP